VLITTVRVGAYPVKAVVAPDGNTVLVSNRGDGTVSLFDSNRLVVRATLPVCATPEDIVILQDSSKAFVSCPGAASQVAVVDLKRGQVLTLLDVGRNPVHMALKPDGGEIMVSDFDEDSISSIETTTNEVGNTFVIGNRPAWSVVTGDSSRLYVSNFESNSISVYDIDFGKVLANVPVGRHPEGLALTRDGGHVLVLGSESGDVAVVEHRLNPSVKKNEREYWMMTMIPVGAGPNAIATKSFTLGMPASP